MKFTHSNNAPQTRFACVACAVALALTAFSSCASPERAEDAVDVRGDEVVTAEMLRESTEEELTEEAVEALSGLGYVGDSADEMKADVTEAANAVVEEVAATWASFGAGIENADALPVAQVFERAQALNGQRMTLEGEVRNVCLKKGCWMNITDGSNDLFIKFKDYGFFVPMDIAGKTARVEGVFAMEEISVADQKHYLMDEGKIEEAARITAPAMKYTFMADGAAISN